MPRGHPLLNPHLFLTGHIIARKVFFLLLFLFVCSCLCPLKRFQNCLLWSGTCCIGCVSGWWGWQQWPLLVPPNPIFLWFQHTPHVEKCGSDGNCSGEDLMLGETAGLLSGSLRRERDTARLEASPAAGSLCRGVTSNIPISKRAETSLFTPWALVFSWWVCLMSTPSVLASHQVQACRCLAKSSWHQL